MAAHNFAICCGCCQPERKIHFLIDGFVSAQRGYSALLSIVGSCIDFSDFGEGEKHRVWETSMKHCSKNTRNH